MDELKAQAKSHVDLVDRPAWSRGWNDCARALGSGLDGRADFRRVGAWAATDEDDELFDDQEAGSE